MASKARSSNKASLDPYVVDRHFGDIAPSYSGSRGNAAGLRASGAADLMWQKVEDDLDRMDRAEIEECDDE